VRAAKSHTAKLACRCASGQTVRRIPNFSGRGRDNHDCGESQFNFIKVGSSLPFGSSSLSDGFVSVEGIQGSWLMTRGLDFNF
jgi:hypothetical protein